MRTGERASESCVWLWSRWAWISSRRFDDKCDDDDDDKELIVGGAAADAIFIWRKCDQMGGANDYVGICCGGERHTAKYSQKANRGGGRESRREKEGEKRPLIGTSHGHQLKGPGPGPWTTTQTYTRAKRRAPAATKLSWVDEEE